MIQGKKFSPPYYLSRCSKMWHQKYQKLKLLVFSYHEVWNLILQDTTPNKILSLKTEKLSSLWSKNKKSSKNMKMEQHKNWKNQPHRRFSAFIFRIGKYFERLDHMIIVRNLTVKVSECRIWVHKSLCVPTFCRKEIDWT